MSPRERFIRARSAQLGLDPDAVVAIGSVEGPAAVHGGVSVGDHGTSFGPFQLHEGGALPAGKGSAWAHSNAGINYALQRMAQVAKGLHGKAAVAAISSRFERPADVPGEIAKAMGYYGGGAADMAAPGAQGAAPSRAGDVSSGLTSDALRSMTAAYLLQQSASTAAGGAPDSSGLLALAVARRQSQAASDTYGATPSAKPLVTKAPASLAIPVEGGIGHEDPHFLAALTAAAHARGAVKIVATSGERDPQHNAAVGGATHSNHLPDKDGFGHAMDGYAVLQDGSRVPLGTFLAPVAGKFRLRSGATFNWGGKPDVVHVDDGLNQR